ncbi:glycosyltransferase family 61 protein [Acetobacter senegalensis]|uniref:glycosyltransferase family 61 protein n=1 Tax=Acetobacter senegalensis TaxID=446692 RepID=UPI00209DE9AE|nr:glycosyltransferase family 61 protein [Acetobacter senegalensis]MCP1197760.1 glycosyltransferase family 61 protein [Acetobacter senegalensis]
MDFIDNLQEISELTDSISFETGCSKRILIAASSKPIQPLPLFIEDEVFSARKKDRLRWQKWHDPADTSHWGTLPLSVYCLENCVISIFGMAYWQDKLIRSPDIMMTFSRKRLHFLPLNVTVSLPIRDIETPCVCWMGWGTQTYGHLIVEMLPRLVMLRETILSILPSHKYLVDTQAPTWFINFLKNYIGIKEEDFEFFDSSTERVNLRKCILVSQVMDKIIHPLVKSIYNKIYIKAAPLWNSMRIDKVFLTRSFVKDGLRGVFCSNELNLARIAANEFGFSVIAPETLPLVEQIKIFAQAKVITGVCGSALHTTIFSQPGTIVGGIEPNNRLQSNIANLLGHRMGFVSFEENEPKFLNEDVFRFFLERILSPKKHPESCKHYITGKQRFMKEIISELDKSISVEGETPFENFSNENKFHFEILSHKRNIGNTSVKIVSSTGKYKDQDPIEAIAIIIPEKENYTIECRFLSEKENLWSEWISSPAWVGIKGEYRALLGLDMRISSNYRDQYYVKYAIRFLGDNKIYIFSEKNPFVGKFSIPIVYISICICKNKENNLDDYTNPLVLSDPL